VLQRIVDDARRAVQITDGIRNMAKKVESERIPTDVNEVVE
jgi:hypothetical protein